MRGRLQHVFADRTIQRLVIAYLFASLLDLITTYAVLTAGGDERNPLLGFFFARYPFVVGAVLKLLLAVVIGIYILWSATWSPRWRRAARWELAAALLVLTLVVLNNLIALGA